MTQGAKLIVVAAYSKTDDGRLVPAFAPREIDTEAKAERIARAMAKDYAGVITWSRDVDVTFGDYGPPTILFQHGELPDPE